MFDLLRRERPRQQRPRTGVSRADESYIAHAGLLGGFAIAEHAAYVETAVAGQVFEDAETIAGLLTRFDTLRNEALRASESLAFIERTCEEWKATGARAATQGTTAEPA